MTMLDARRPFAAQRRAADAPAAVLPLASLLDGIGSTHVGLCLTDERDVVRYCNAAFRAAFFPNAAPEPGDFTQALADAIAAGRGIRLQSVPLAEFVARVREQRRTRGERHDFSLDTADGKWWRIADHKLANGWILVVATDISPIKHEESALRSAHASALDAALTDDLTRLPNRRAGMERLRALLAAGDPGRRPLAAALIDIDRFKQINDHFGHATGDDVIVAFASFLGQRAEAGGHVSRIGGEEFLFLLPDTSLAQAKTTFGAMLDALPPAPRRDGAAPVAFSFSAGLAMARAGDDPDALLGRADAALYAAKAAGRGRITVATV